MAAKTAETPKADETAAPAESTRPAPIPGKCNRPMNTAEGLLDRCHKVAAHADGDKPSDHVSHTSYNKSVATAKAKAQQFQAWRELNDPQLKARREALAAKKLATLKALAAELGYTLTK